MKKLLFAVVLAAALILPATAFAGTFNGVVVGKAGGNLAIASKGGVVRTVHSRAHVQLGARVHVNGTAVRAFGRAQRARVHGVIVRRIAGTTFLAAGRSLLVVRGRSGRRLASAAPKTGAVVNTTVAIANGGLTQQSMQVVGQAGTVTIQATVTAVGPGTVTITVNGQSLTIPLPAGIQLPTSLVGQSVTLTVTLSPNGPTATADDENEADDQAENDDNDNNDDQGDDNDDHGGDSGPGGGGDDGDD